MKRVHVVRWHYKRKSPEKLNCPKLMRGIGGRQIRIKTNNGRKQSRVCYKKDWSTFNIIIAVTAREEIPRQLQLFGPHGFFFFVRWGGGLTLLKKNSWKCHCRFRLMVRPGDLCPTGALFQVTHAWKEGVLLVTFDKMRDFIGFGLATKGLRALLNYEWSLNTFI